MNNRCFHFSIGPVQAFVAQARRTRDFWAGSFLLSTLSAVAMCEVRAQNGTILFPKPDKAFLDAITGITHRTGPKQGVIPNRFKAEVKDAFDPARVEEAVRLAWLAMAKLAWRRLSQAARNSDRTRRVWSRQVGVDLDTGTPILPDPFWRMVWAVGSIDEGEDLLDRRKNLRIDTAPLEGGAKCMLMDGWQELSGVERPKGELLKTFWEPLQEHLARYNPSDLRAGEQLCALSMVKRLFAHDFHRLRVPMPSRWTFTGWWLPTHVPSTARLAAAPWLVALIRAADESNARSFVTKAEKLDAGRERPVDMVAQALRDVDGARAQLASLGASVFFDASLRSTEDFPNQEAAAVVCSELEKLYALTVQGHDGRDTQLGRPSPYFAVLAMDGDDLGRNMAIREKQSTISTALANFTSKVTALVEEHSGFLVYAGGDDVLALLPVSNALPCARTLRDHYQSCFKGGKVQSTLSGAVLFANHKLPLAHSLAEAHALLDNVAKDGRGRDAIAVQVSSRGGDLIQWAQPWDIAFAGEELVVEALARDMSSDDSPFSHRFFHRIKALLRLINPDPRRDSSPLDDEIAIALFTAELLDSSLYRDDDEARSRAPQAVASPEVSRIDRARNHVRKLLEQCRPHQRRRTEDGKKASFAIEPTNRIEADGAFLLRFLSRHQGSPQP